MWGEGKRVPNLPLRADAPVYEGEKKKTIVSSQNCEGRTRAPFHTSKKVGRALGKKNKSLKLPGGRDATFHGAATISNGVLGEEGKSLVGG